MSAYPLTSSTPANLDRRLKMLILIAEDEDSKLTRLREFVSEAFPNDEVREARSVRGTIDALQEKAPDLLLLDMSLPTYDIAAGESGGRPQGFGGIEVVRHMERDEIRVPTLVVTQHPVIPKDGKLVDLKDIEKMVRDETPDNFRGLIYYDTVSGGWKKDLLTAILSVANEGTESR
jgi:CheY-like chemotaxis protein